MYPYLMSAASVQLGLDQTIVTQSLQQINSGMGVAPLIVDPHTTLASSGYPTLQQRTKMLPHVDPIAHNQGHIALTNRVMAKQLMQSHQRTSASGNEQQTRGIAV